jgi:hypothetical protein
MKTIHALTIIDKSTSMSPYRSRTIEGINSNINALKAEVDKDTIILNTQLQFSDVSQYNRLNVTEKNSQFEKCFVFKRIGEKVETLIDMTDSDYAVDGGTPLLDAIGYGIEKIKEFHMNDLGNNDLKIIVTIFTDGEENSSCKWDRNEIKKMIEHLESDGKWTFTFVGCGSFENVSHTSSTLGIKGINSVAYVATDSGFADAYSKISTSYSNFARSAKTGIVDASLFEDKSSTVK